MRPMVHLAHFAGKKLLLLAINAENQVESAVFKQRSSLESAQAGLPAGPCPAARACCFQPRCASAGWGLASGRGAEASGGKGRLFFLYSTRQCIQGIVSDGRIQSLNPIGEGNST